jgi:flagellar protein FlaC
MGKDEDEPVRDTNDSVAFNEKKSVDKSKSEKDSETSNKAFYKPEDKKVDTEELRKVIKIGEQNKVDNTQKQEKGVEFKQNKIGEIDLESTSRDALEQKRAILQSIKDFDFLIKKNSEEITNLNKKLDSITKDLDDLVSLYEIVSEQMNPFVGLSKVTKKRLDSLENFNQEIDNLKTRIADIEIFVEKTSTGFESIKLKGEEDNIPEISSEHLDKIIENSFSNINFDQKIDELIDEFIENLKFGM